MEGVFSDNINDITELFHRIELQKPLNYTAMKMAMGVRVKREKRPSGDTNKDLKR